MYVDCRIMIDDAIDISWVECDRGLWRAAPFGLAVRVGGRAPPTARRWARRGAECWARVHGEVDTARHAVGAFPGGVMYALRRVE